MGPPAVEILDLSRVTVGFRVSGFGFGGLRGFVPFVRVSMGFLGWFMVQAQGVWRFRVFLDPKPPKQTNHLDIGPLGCGLMVNYWG